MAASSTTAPALRSRALRAGGEQRAALGLCCARRARGRGVPSRRRRQRSRVAAQQLDLEFAPGAEASPATMRPGRRPAPEQRRAPHAAQRAADVGAVAAAPVRRPRPAARRRSPTGVPACSARRRAGTAVRALAARHVVLQARHRILARGLQRLHPAPRPRDRRRSATRPPPITVGAVEIGGLQAQRGAVAPRPATAAATAARLPAAPGTSARSRSSRRSWRPPVLDECRAALRYPRPRQQAREQEWDSRRPQAPADAIKSGQTTDLAAAERNALDLLTEAACKTVFTYFDTLIRQLEVLKPVSKTRYALERRTVFEHLPMVDLKIDARRSASCAATTCMSQSPCTGGCAMAQARLRQGLPARHREDRREAAPAGAAVHAQAVRNPDNNKLQEMRCEMAVDFAFGVTVTPEHDSASLHFKVMNLDGFETVTPRLLGAGSGLDAAGRTRQVAARRVRTSSSPGRAICGVSRPERRKIAARPARG